MKIDLRQDIMSYMLVVPSPDGSDTFVVEHYYVAVDEPVEVGQAVALVRSDRFAWDIPATTSGTVSTCLAEVGSTVAMGAPLIDVREQGTGNRDRGSGIGDQEAGIGDQGKEEDAAQSTIHNPQSTIPNPQPPTPRQVRATPVARRVAAAHGLDLTALSGTGRGNNITRADVLAAIGTRDEGRGTREQPAFVPEQEDSNIQVLAGVQPSAFSLGYPLGASAFSAHLSPHAPHPTPLAVPYALTAVEADLGTALATLAQHEQRLARRGTPITITACVAAAAVAALGEHPLLNSAWHADGIIMRSRVHLHVEQATAFGAQTTLVPNAADLNVVGLARQLAQHNGDEPSDHQPATFTIAQRNAPWWSHVQPDATHTAALTIGAVTQQGRVVETPNGDMIVVRPVVLLVLAYDARVIDQRQADAFVCALQQRLEHFDSL